jgi:hypothetical protein
MPLRSTPQQYQLFGRDLPRTTAMHPAASCRPHRILAVPHRPPISMPFAR